MIKINMENTKSIMGKFYTMRHELITSGKSYVEMNGICYFIGIADSVSFVFPVNDSNFISAEIYINKNILNGSIKTFIFDISKRIGFYFIDINDKSLKIKNSCDGDMYAICTLKELNLYNRLDYIKHMITSHKGNMSFDLLSILSRNIKIMKELGLEI